jgi:hypothetical protein
MRSLTIPIVYVLVGIGAAIGAYNKISDKCQESWPFRAAIAGLLWPMRVGQLLFYPDQSPTTCEKLRAIDQPTTN